MTTYVRNGTGNLYKRVDPCGFNFTITPKNKKYFEQGIVLLEQYGETRLIILSKAELETNFTLLTEDDDDD